MSPTPKHTQSQCANVAHLFLPYHSVVASRTFDTSDTQWVSTGHHLWGIFEYARAHQNDRMALLAPCVRGARNAEHRSG